LKKMGKSGLPYKKVTETKNIRDNFK